MFKKVVIADSLAPLVDTIFQNYDSFNGGILFLGLIYFSFQIYCDFSGYSDIAIGTAKLFGFELMSNFKFPYFSKNIGEFWKKWHVSLSTWFRDYLYIPLGGSKAGKWISLRNIFIVFIISGFWHGANWTFLIWGLIHAILYVLKYLIGNNKKYIQVFTIENKWIKTIKDSIQMIFTFSSVTIAWVFFRSENISKSLNYLNHMISNFTFPASYRIGLFSIIILLFIELMAHQNERNLFQYHRIKSRRIKKLLRFITYYILSLCVFTYFTKSETSFIYFQS